MEASIVLLQLLYLYTFIDICTISHVCKVMDLCICADLRLGILLLSLISFDLFGKRINLELQMYPPYTR